MEVLVNEYRCCNLEIRIDLRKPSLETLESLLRPFPVLR